MVQVPSCPQCAGVRPFCIHKSYPFPTANLERQVKGLLKKEFFGPSYSAFVGKSGYPHVQVGPMLGLEPKAGLDSPESWWGMDYQQVIELRSYLLRSKKPESIRSQSRYVQDMQELALARKPTDVETQFTKAPSFSFRLSEAIQPMGPSATVSKMDVAGNVYVRPKVERIVGDELKAGEQAYLLYETGMDVYQLASVFASGSLGLQESKKLVPSRWSTTGVQSIVADNLIKKIKQFPHLNEHRVYASEYLDNHFEILVMPGNWEFENFEAWAPGSNWSSQTHSRIIEEYEPYEGRSSYAESQAGGFYSSRIGCTEGLMMMKKQARVVVFREVYEGYTIPVGSWQILENVRNAFKGSYRRFDTKREALQYIGTRLRIPISEYVKKSVILQQRKIGDFI